jgi:hypothetical protein
MAAPRRLTDEDERMLDWMARWAPVTTMQVSQRFVHSRRMTYLRTPSPARDRLVPAVSVALYQFPDVLCATGIATLVVAAVTHNNAR